MARLAADDWGVVSLGELEACGLSRDAVVDRVQRGTLHRRYQGVYVVGHPHLTLEGELLAAVKALGPEAFLSHYSAAAVWRHVEWDGREPEVTVPGAGTLAIPGIRVHRSRTLTRHDVRTYKRIPITSPARTLVDLAAVLGYGPLRRAVRQAQSLRHVSRPQLQRVMDRCGRFRGKRNLLRILADGPTPTRSELEDIVLDLILDAGFERPDVNVPLELDGRRVVPDFRWPEQRLVVEADGAAWHDHKLAREDDAERQALLEAHGERVLRVRWREALSGRAATVRRLAAAGAPRAPG